MKTTKTKQYCVIKNIDGEIGVSTFEFTPEGLAESKKEVIHLVKEEGDIAFDIFDFGVPSDEFEFIANIKISERYKIICIVSK